MLAMMSSLALSTKARIMNGLSATLSSPGIATALLM
jgi:hypothetical protein